MSFSCTEVDPCKTMAVSYAATSMHGILSDDGPTDKMFSSEGIQRDTTESHPSSEHESFTDDTPDSTFDDSVDDESEDEQDLDPLQKALKVLNNIRQIVPAAQEFPGREEFEKKLKQCKLGIKVASYAASARLKWAKNRYRVLDNRANRLATLLREEKAGEIYRAKRLSGCGVIEYCETFVFPRTKSYEVALENELGEVSRHRKWTLAMESIDNLKADMLDYGLIDVDIADLAVRVFQLMKDVSPKWERDENQFKTSVAIDFSVLEDLETNFIKAVCSFLDIDWADFNWLQ